MSEPRSNMEITDRAGLARYRRDCAVTDLTGTVTSIECAIAILRKLAERDTVDLVCGGAIVALDDAGDHLDDVLTALEDGRLTEAGEGG
jgi:hypothetical protein